jgi:hypothetical protein
MVPKERKTRAGFIANYFTTDLPELLEHFKASVDVL